MSGLLVRPGRTDLLVDALERLARSRVCGPEWAGQDGRPCDGSSSRSCVGLSAREALHRGTSGGRPLSGAPRPCGSGGRPPPCGLACVRPRARAPRVPSGDGALRRGRASRVLCEGPVSRGSTTTPVLGALDEVARRARVRRATSGRPAAAASSRRCRKCRQQGRESEHVCARQLRGKVAMLDETVPIHVGERQRADKRSQAGVVFALADDRQSHRDPLRLAAATARTSRSTPLFARSRPTVTTRIGRRHGDPRRPTSRNGSMFCCAAPRTPARIRVRPAAGRRASSCPPRRERRGEYGRVTRWSGRSGLRPLVPSLWTRSLARDVQQ